MSKTTDPLAIRLAELPPAEKNRVLALIDQEGPHWEAIARELGGASKATAYGRHIVEAALIFFEHKDPRMSAEREKWLVRIMTLSHKLQNAIADDPIWLEIYLDGSGDSVLHNDGWTSQTVYNVSCWKTRPRRDIPKTRHAKDHG